LFVCWDGRRKERRKRGGEERKLLTFGGGAGQEAEDKRNQAITEVEAAWPERHYEYVWGTGEERE